MFNFSGNSRPLNAANLMSLHSTNPGVGATPAAGSELTAAPYERKSCVFSAPTAQGTAAVSALTATVQFSLDLTTNQTVGFIGLWENSTYIGYIEGDEVLEFIGTATARSCVVQASTTVLVRDNPQQ